VTTSPKPRKKSVATRKTAARKTATRKTATRKSTARNGSTRKTTTRRTSTTRRRNSTATTFGAAVGTVVVASLLGAPWSVRIALILAIALAGVGYLVWSRRS
jgi:Flp pilus assembly protein TadB